MSKIIRLKDGERFVVTDRQTLLDIVSFAGGMELKAALQEEFDNLESRYILVESNLKEVLKQVFSTDVSDEVWMAAVIANLTLNNIERS